MRETRNTGLFIHETYQAGPVRLELAAWQEWQLIELTPDRRVTQDHFSISGAAIWETMDGYSAVLSLARSQRAPTAQELFARGVHLATTAMS